MNARAPRSVEFRKEREALWIELQGMVDRALTKGLSTLSQDELQRLPVLYRATLSSLSVARRTAMDRALVQYLEALASRAHLAVYGSRKPMQGAVVTFLTETFPRSVRRMAAELGLASGLFFLGVLVAFALISADSSWFYAFVDPALAAGRGPSASTEDLRTVLYSGDESGLVVFASFLFTHNARIGMASFALGFAAGVPTALLLFTNGLMLGAFVAVYHDHGLLMPLLGWLLPHGVPEIGALLLCGAAGLHLGRAVLWPGDRRIRDALKEHGQRASMVVAGCVLLFAVAGVVEGVFRQVIKDDFIRFALASFNLLWLSTWIVLAGRGSPRGAGP